MESTIVIPISPAPWTRRTFGVSLTTAATSSNGCTSASMSSSEETPPNRRAKSKKKKNKKKRNILSRTQSLSPFYPAHTLRTCPLRCEFSRHPSRSLYPEKEKKSLLLRVIGVLYIPPSIRQEADEKIKLLFHIFLTLYLIVTHKMKKRKKKKQKT